MSTELARIPDRVLPAPGRGDLPEPVALRRMIGPSIILAGLSIGSGEFVLWPRLTAEFGFAVFWACWIGVTIQFFLNMEIERWTLLTGESAVGNGPGAMQWRPFQILPVPPESRGPPVHGGLRFASASFPAGPPRITLGGLPRSDRPRGRVTLLAKRDR